MKKFFTTNYTVQLFFVCCVVIQLIVAEGCKKNTTSEPPNEEYTLTVTTLNNTTSYQLGAQITFNLTLLKGGIPVRDSIIAVYDDLSYLCSSIAPTDVQGKAAYQVNAARSGGFSFIFFHPRLNVYASSSIFIQETSLNDSFHTVQGTYPTLPLGSNQTMDKQTLSQKSFDVTVNTLKDAATNPIFVGAMSLCLIGVAGSAAVGAGAPLAAVACPAAYNVFMGSLLWNVTNNAVDKFVTDPVQKQKAKGILSAAAITQSVMAFNDALIQSPKNGKALASYDYNSYQGTQAGQRAFQRITDVGDAVNTISSVQDLRIQFVNDSTFAFSFSLTNPVSNGYSTMMNEERLVTLGVTLKPHTATPVDTLLSDQFDLFTGWSYLPESNSGSSFRDSSGLLIVGNYGTKRSGYYGPMAVKSLTKSINIASDDFTIDAYPICLDGGGVNTVADLNVYLADVDNVPIAGLRLYAANYMIGVANFFGLYGDGTTKQGSRYATVGGKLSMRKIADTLYLHYNDGPAIIKKNITSVKTATKLRLEIQAYGSYSIPHMKLDWLRVTKP